MALPSPFTILPQELLKTIDQQFWNFDKTGFCYAQMSHRSPHYAKINEGSQKAIKQFYNVPSNFEVLYLPTNCAHPSLPFNLCKATNGRAIYIVNDSESQHAYEQALKINPQTIKVHSAADRKDIFKQTEVQPATFYTFYSLLSYEDGVFSQELEPLEGQILVCSLHGCSHYQGVDFSKQGAVIFESGKGLGLSGMSVVIIRNDLIQPHLDICPDMMDYKMTLTIKSIINTPYTMVPLILLKQIQYFINNGYSLAKSREALVSVKEEYQALLAKYTEVTKTQAEGLVKIKINEKINKDEIQEYGVIREGWMVIMLQVWNKGGAQKLASILFE